MVSKVISSFGVINRQWTAIKEIIITFNLKRSCHTTNCVDKYWWCASSCAFNVCACVWPKCILFFNYVNTANRTALMIGINAKRSTHIKWKHIHKITVYTSMPITISINVWPMRCLFFLANISTLHAWKCANEWNARTGICCMHFFTCNPWYVRTSIDVWNVVECTMHIAHVLWWLCKRWRRNKRQSQTIKKTGPKRRVKRCAVHVYDFHYEHWLL